MTWKILLTMFYLILLLVILIMIFYLFDEAWRVKVIRQLTTIRSADFANQRQSGIVMTVNSQPSW